MKQIIWISLLFIFILGCNAAESPAETEQVAAREHTEAHLHEKLSDGKPAGHADGMPELNNGRKWKADQSTNENVAQLASIVSDFKKQSSPEIADFRSFTDRFTEGLSKMVNECKMQGPEHDALHVWLEPLMRDNKEMHTLDTKEALQSHLTSIDNRLKIFSEYFE